jgi:hypothetical protein
MGYRNMYGIHVDCNPRHITQKHVNFEQATETYRPQYPQLQNAHAPQLTMVYIPLIP